MLINSGIQRIADYSGVNSIKGGNNVQDSGKLEAHQNPVTESQPRSYDFTNISRREVDALWQSGEFSVDLPPLILPLEGLDLTKDTKLQMEDVYDKKIDYIDFFEQRIEYKKSENLRVEHLEKTLNTILALQGKSMQPKIDMHV